MTGTVLPPRADFPDTDPWATVELTPHEDDQPGRTGIPLIEVAATGRHDAWTAGEIEALIHLFRADRGIPEIAAAVGRRLQATRHKIQALGLRRNSRRPWTAAEDTELRKRYGTEPVADIARDLGRSPATVYARAGTIGCADFQAPPWSDWEVDALACLVAAGHPHAEAAARLGRALGGVVTKAHELGLESPNARARWSAAEDTELVRLAAEEGMTARAIATRLTRSGPVRTRAAVKARLRDLGIERDVASPWRADEDELLRAFYARALSGPEIARRLPGRTVGGVRWRARHLGLHHPSPTGARQGRPWTTEEHATLRRLYGGTSVDEIARRLHRPKGSVYNEAFRLGLSGGYRHRWTDADDQDLLACSGSLRALCAQRGWNYQVASRRRARLRSAPPHG